MRSFASRRAAVLLGLALPLLCATARGQAPRREGRAPRAPEEARRLEEAFSHVADHVGPSVVQIEITARPESKPSLDDLFAPRTGEAPLARGMGSGIVVSSDGAILTNHHVIEGALSLYVRLRDGRRLPAVVVGRDVATDLAVVRVEATGLVPAELATNDGTKVGEWVVAIGSPFGLGHSVTVGVISAKGRGGLGMNAIEDYLQTDASINPGNSGGPLCDLDGHVVGVNTMIVGKANGIGFAIPSPLARRVVDQILKHGVVKRAWLGVTVQDLTPDLAKALKRDETAGALVTSVSEGGPARQAAIAPGDVILRVAGRKLEDERDLVREVLRHDPSDSLDVEIARGEKRYAARVVLAARSEPQAPPPAAPSTSSRDGLGLTVRELTPALSVKLGLPAKVLPFVVAVASGSPADRAGVREGDVVVEADGRPLPSPLDLQSAAADGEVLVRMRRGSGSNALWFYTVIKR